MKKKLSIILACIMLVGVLGGCGNSFDASAYLKALLDNSYMNDSSQLVSMKVATAEEAAEIYKEDLDSVVSGFIQGTNLSEEQEEEYRKLFMNIFAAAKYTVGEAEKQDDGSIVVTVTYEKMNIFVPASEACMEMLLEQMEVWQGGDETPSNSEIMEWSAMALKDCLEDALKNVTYDAPQTDTVKISLKDNVWTPSTSDLSDLAGNLFDINDASLLQ